MAVVRKTALTLVVAAILGAGGGAVVFRVHDANQPHKVMLCLTGAVVVEVDGREVLLEDQGEPGPDHCDVDRVPRRGNGWRFVLGFDCRIRDAAGRVVGTRAPNRPDHTCGQEEVHLR